MTWRSVLVLGILNGLVVGLFVGGIVALALGMWLFGSALLGLTILVLQLTSKARETAT